jgi:hypothetical protein
MSISWSVRDLPTISLKGHSLLDSTPFWNSFLREKTLEFISKSLSICRFNTVSHLPNACLQGHSQLDTSPLLVLLSKGKFFSGITLYTNKLEHLFAFIQFHTCLMFACKVRANLTEASFWYFFLRVKYSHFMSILSAIVRLG